MSAHLQKYLEYNHTDRADLLFCLSAIFPTILVDPADEDLVVDGIQERDDADQVCRYVMAHHKEVEKSTGMRVNHPLDQRCPVYMNSQSLEKRGRIRVGGDLLGARFPTSLEGEGISMSLLPTTWAHLLRDVAVRLP